MEFKRITDSQDECLKEMSNLYLDAFPISERRSLSQLMYLIENEPRMFFTVIKLEGACAGFFIYWILDDFYYLEHFAVLEKMRNRKIGQQVLDYIHSDLSGNWILEVEPPKDEICTRRVEYYKRNGFEVVEKDYTQPPYSKNGEGLDLWIMSNKADNDSKLLENHINKIKQDVYINNYGIE